MRPHTSKNPNCFSSSSRFCKGKQARGGLLKAQELDDRVGDGKLLEVFRGGAVKELEERGDDGGNSTRRIRSTGELRVRIAKGSNESEESEEMEKDTSGNFFG